MSPWELLGWVTAIGASVIIAALAVAVVSSVAFDLARRKRVLRRDNNHG